jgi:hypothetical protein
MKSGCPASICYHPTPARARIGAKSIMAQGVPFHGVRRATRGEGVSAVQTSKPIYALGCNLLTFG